MNKLKRTQNGMNFKMHKRDKAVTIIDHDAHTPHSIPWWGVAYALAVWGLLAACIIMSIARMADRMLSS